MSWTCQCPRDLPDTLAVCTRCMTDRPVAQTISSTCRDCREPTRLVQLTPGDDRRDRCASCHVEHLRQRAQRHPISPADLARCKAELERCYAQAEAKWKSQRP